MTALTKNNGISTINDDFTVVVVELSFNDKHRHYFWYLPLNKGSY